MKIAIIGKKSVGKSRFCSNLLDKRYVHASTVDFHEYVLRNDIVIIDCPANVCPVVDLYLLIIDGSKGLDVLDIDLFHRAVKTGVKVHIVIRYGLENLHDLPKCEYSIVIHREDLYEFRENLINKKNDMEKQVNDEIRRIDKKGSYEIVNSDGGIEVSGVEVSDSDVEVSDGGVEVRGDDGVRVSGGSNHRLIRVQLIGAPNAGKSTLFNALTGKNVAVSAEAGTTKEGVQTILYDKFVIQDSCGGRMHANADVVVIVVDGVKGLLNSDKKMLSKVKGVGCVCALNKCDQEQFKAIKLSVPTMHTSGLTGKGVKLLLEQCEKTAKLSSTRLSTSVLNKWIADCKHRFHGVRVKYSCHVSVRPYIVVMFVNDLSKQVHLRNMFEEYFGLEGVRVIVKLKKPFNKYV